MTRAVVPHMRRQRAGRIVNVGSVLGFLPAPYAALYAATKHAVEGLLRRFAPAGLIDTGIRKDLRLDSG